MSKVATLKKKAAEFEQKKQFDKALQLYLQIIEGGAGKGEEEDDVALYNRVGDILLRQGNVGDAVSYYEKAVDLYAEGGFFNNAIALCNKILRHSPGRNSIYYKLGKISAKKGFKSDAKQNFLEYADRMQKGGQIDEAFRALKEFADLCPDQDDIRLMLAEQLSKKNRKSEAMQQLQQLYDKFDSEGRQGEARATADRMKAIDPNVEVKAQEVTKKEKSGDLIFLDVDYDTPKKPPTRPTGRFAVEPPPKAPAPAPEPPPPSSERAPAPKPIPPLEIEDATLEIDHGASTLADEVSAHRDSIPGLTTSQVPGFETTPFDSFAGGPDAGVSLDPAPLTESEFGELALHETEEKPNLPAPAHDLALPGDLPMLEIDGDEPSGAALELIEPEPEEETAAPAAPAGARRRDSTDLPPIDMGDFDFEIGAPPAAQAEVEEEAEEAAEEEEEAAAPRDSMSEALDLLDVEPEVAPIMRPSGAQPPPKKAPKRAPERVPEPEPEPVMDEVPENTGDLPLIMPEEAERESAPRRRASSSVLARSVDLLRAQVEMEPGNYLLHRQFAEALLEDGDREGGLQELETALVGFERSNDLENAQSVADEIIRLNPGSVRHHQKRVEYAFRTNDRSRLVDAYNALADSLFTSGQADKARAVYMRVLDLMPDEPRAKAALSALAPVEAPIAAPAKKEPPPRSARPTTGVGKRYTAEIRSTPVPEPEPVPAASSDDDFIDLGDFLRDETPKNTRMVVDEEQPSGDEAADFADMLRKFKQGVAENVEEEDHESHYDLGVAYKEMGLVDEAIAEFQKALRGAEKRVRTYEALGQCFLEKNQLEVAITILGRALAETNDDEKLVGVLYLLGYANEALQRYAEATAFYQRVFAVDIQFRDVAQRLQSLDKVGR